MGYFVPRSLPSAMACSKQRGKPKGATHLLLANHGSAAEISVGLFPAEMGTVLVSGFSIKEVV